MRLPSFPHLLRTFYTLTNVTTKLRAPQKAASPFIRATAINLSMPTIPFFGSLFSSSSSSNKMSYPVQKSDQEWQAVLSKGMSFPFTLPSLRAGTDAVLSKNNFAFCGKRGPKLHSLENTTSTCLKRGSTPAPLAMRHSTRQPTNSSRAADGPHTSIASQAL